ncbi:MAG: DUF1152 domain-containing protein [Proteobacteria bacterium]|nr:DUF1152 domain-containing protein [Pseudomonadota bacterium]
MPAPSITISQRRTFLTDTFLADGLVYSFPQLTGKRVLVHGLGGGRDIIAACALATVLRDRNPAACLYANTKRQSDGLDRLRRGEHTFSALFTVRPDDHAVAKHGTSTIDQWIAPGDDGSPIICHLPYHASEKTRADIVADLRALDLDLIIGLDIGGDSLLKRDRDWEMLTLIKKTGVRCVHLVVALGADGECSPESLRAHVEQRLESGSYRGWFPLDGLTETMNAFAGRLDPSRTPNIILSAFGAHKDDPTITVRRPPSSPVDIPTPWLRCGFVFDA